VGQASATPGKQGLNKILEIRNTDQQDGLYLPVNIGGVDINCLIDTGSTITVLHPRKYEAMSEDSRPPLEDEVVKLRMADGGLVVPLGSALFKVRIQGRVYEQRIIVAEVEAPVVLGYDFLHKYDCQLDMGRGVLKLGGRTIQCERESQMPSIFKITVKQTVMIPGASEMVLQAEVQGAPKGCSEVLVDTTSRSLRKMGLLVANSVVDPSQGLVAIRVVNLHSEPQTLYKRTCAATGERVEGIESMDTYTEESTANVNKIDVTSEEELPEHLQALWERSIANLTPEQGMEVKRLLQKHQAVFAKNKNDLGRTNIVQHRINTGNSAPIRQQPRRVPLAKKDEAAEEIQRMLETGVIEPSKSPWAAPIVLVRKKDGSVRFCIDYRRLNNVTLKDSYPLPRIDDSLDALRGSTWFSTADLASVYWQVEMDPRDAEKTAFATTCGFYQFRVMPFGLCNAPSTFERMMEYLMAGLHWETCLIYLDDIIVFSDSFEQHIERLDEVLSRIRKGGLKISPKKCHFFQTRVNFLGHVVSAEGIATDPEKITAVQQWPTPSSVHDVRSFLGTCSYYRKYIKSFADIARPLHKLTEKTTKFHWSSDCDAAFHALQHSLITAPILGYPDMKDPFVLDTDASGFGIGAVLSQVRDGKEQVIAYFSKTLGKAERNYCVTRRELLAVVESVKHFHHYLYGINFTVRTDHGALNWLLRFKNPEGQIARWMELLATYDMVICHRPGKQHGNADGMSRRPCAPCDYCSRQEKKDLEEEVESVVAALRAVRRRDDSNGEIEDSAQATTWLQETTPKDLRNAQLQDPVLSVVVGWKEKDDGRPPWSDVSAFDGGLKTYWGQWDRLHLRDGVLYRRWIEQNTSLPRWQLLLPEALRKDVLTMLHDDPTSGHLGVTKTIARVRSRFYWEGYRLTIEGWCRNCMVCQARKAPQRKARGKMQQYIVGEPMERVAMDILGPLPESLSGNKYILIIADYFTRWTEAYAMKDQEAATVTRIFLHEFICRYGLPRQIHTDQGRQFESRLFQELCVWLKIDKTRTTAYHPQSDGLVERFNRTVEDLLSKYVSPTQRDWDDHLPLAMMAYRSSVHESTGQSPCQMMFAREPDLPADLLLGPSPKDKPDRKVPVYLETLIDRMNNVHELARERMFEASANQKKRYDHKASVNKYNRGDAVWLHNTARIKGRTPKLQSPWEGPFLVVEALSDVVYHIQKTQNAKSKCVHHDRLKPCFGHMINWLKDIEVEMPVEEEAVVNNPEIEILVPEEVVVNNPEIEILVPEGEVAPDPEPEIPAEDAENEPALYATLEIEEVGRGRRQKRSPQRYRDSY
jgi:transposase InsO family protein/predicted aspartyl protease